MPPTLEFCAPTTVHIINSLFFIGMSLAIAWMGNANRLLMEDLKKERDQSHLLLSELQHRGKNSLMVLQAIASQTLKDEKERTVFLDRLTR